MMINIKLGVSRMAVTNEEKKKLESRGWLSMALFMVLFPVLFFLCVWFPIWLGVATPY